MLKRTILASAIIVSLGVFFAVPAYAQPSLAPPWLDLISDQPHINEFKHTRLSR